MWKLKITIARAVRCGSEIGAQQPTDNELQLTQTFCRKARVNARGGISDRSMKQAGKIHQK